MGCVSSNPKGDGVTADELAANREIEKQAAKDQERDRNIIKMLILGAGESGKSTLVKQMITLYGSGFSSADRIKATKDIHNNIVEAMRTLVNQSDLMEDLNCRIKDDCSEAKSFFKNLKEDETVVLNDEVANHISLLWKDSGIQATYNVRHLFQVPDSASYYFSRVKEIGLSGYVPTQDDLLRSRVRTTGAIQYNFIIKGTAFNVFDVGGQKSERKKWINCFEGVTAVVFVAAISEYNQVMYEDNSTNRLSESLVLFDSICNSQYFQRTSMILFLNKTDLFQEKIKTVSLSTCFDDFPTESDGDFEFAKMFIEEKFKSKNAHPDKKQIFVHFTTAVSTDNMQLVLASTQTIILNEALASAGIL